MKTISEYIKERNEEFDDMFSESSLYECYDGAEKDLKSFLTSTLKAFIEAEIARLGVGKILDTNSGIKNNDIWVAGFNQALQDQITHLKEITKLL